MSDMSGSDISPDAPEASSGLSRREALRRGAILGGALVWSAPAIQTIGMRGAYAVTPAPGPCPSHLDLKIFCPTRSSTPECVIFEPAGACGGQTSGEFGPHPKPTSGTPFPPGHCFTTEDGCDHRLPGGFLSGITATSSDGGVTWVVTVPTGCEIQEAWAFCGVRSDGISDCGGAASYPAGTRSVTLSCPPKNP